jgi:signal transduction histidine kinase
VNDFSNNSESKGLGFSSLLARVETAREEASFLAKVSSTVSVRTSPQLLLTYWARATVPYIAEWCVVDILESPHSLQRAAVAFDSTGTPRPENFKIGYKTQNLPRFLRTILETGNPLSQDPVNDEEIKNFYSPLDIKGILVAPLISTDRIVIGFISWMRENPASAPNKNLSQGRISIAMELAHRISVGRENSMAYHESKRALEVRDEFISMAGHELKTPLTALQLQTQLLNRMMSDSDSDLMPIDKARTMGRAMGREVDRLQASISQLLDVTRARVGQSEIHKEPMNLSELITSIAQNMNLILTQSGCSISLDLQNGVSGNWDRFRISQVMTNLLSNAAKYASGKPIEVRLKTVADHALFSVKDYGLGIPQAEQEKIFECFVRATQKQAIPGLGLGLYISQQIVTSHGGRLWVESCFGGGAEFFVQLPLA